VVTHPPSGDFRGTRRATARTSPMERTADSVFSVIHGVLVGGSLIGTLGTLAFTHPVDLQVGQFCLNHRRVSVGVDFVQSPHSLAGEYPARLPSIERREIDTQHLFEPFICTFPAFSPSPIFVTLTTR
jgi:hypothetical protein